ncbi:unnamed protein product, partial [marine sediment metagenome]
ELSGGPDMGMERFAEIIHESSALDGENFADIDWKMQALKGVLANRLGFTSVGMIDEYGESVLALPGSRVIAINDKPLPKPSSPPGKGGREDLLFSTISESDAKKPLSIKQRTFLERHYPEKLEAFEKEFKRKNGWSIPKESMDGLKDSVIMGENPSAPEGFNMPHEGKGMQVFDLLQFKIQDRLNSLKKVQKTIEKQTATEIPDNTDAYQTEELYHGKVGRRVGEFDVDHLDPLADSIHESGLDLEDVESFLYARHAPEANKRLQDINPKREDNEALSGMSNEEAGVVMAKYAGNKAMLDIVSQVDAITKKTRQVLVDEGLATPEEIAAWESAYKYYVPLKREGKALVAGMPKKGTGMDIKGAESKKRMTGSAELKAVNILANIVAQHEAAIIRAEKAKVGRAMLTLAETNPSKELW